MSDQQKEARVIDQSIEINASEEAVWKALTDAEELTRWFPPEARVTPGKGGSIWFSWGSGVEGSSLIEVWEPNRRLTLSEPNGVRIDYFIEKSGQATVLRLVHYGFGPGAEWDDAYDATQAGWAYFLYNLRFYLERHAGEPRHMISVRSRVPTREDAWSLLKSAEGLSIRPEDPKVGGSDRFQL